MSFTSTRSPLADGVYSYTISWRRALPDTSLEGVEYQCLPSGLHGVKEDLVYFVHNAYAGVSAFVQEESDEHSRNAKFATVGALVPLTYGRLGKSWLHAAALRNLAKEVISNTEDKRALELYWKEHRQPENANTDISSPSTVRRTSLPPSLDRKRKRASSIACASFPDTGMPKDHPALSVPGLLDEFGPLIFPLYRAALLRKRILILGSPPVQRSCNFVYMLSIFSSIPQTLSDIVQPDTEAPLRIQTLFNVGIHDIPFLTEQKRKARWLACTTDDILGEKHQLYDLLVLLPSPSTQTSRRKWPIIRTSDGKAVKATQRDLRRYRLLRSELDRIHSARSHYSDNPDPDEVSPLMRASTTTLLDEVKHSQPGENEIAEPVSWTSMAYNGFMWWASAGEMEAWENEEARADREMISDLPEVEGLLPDIANRRELNEADSEELQQASATATIVTAYFHHLTSQIIQPLSDVVEEADDDTEEGIAESAISISADDMRAMGLDVWSEIDKEFVREAMELYFGREAVVDEAGTKICGVRIC